MERNGEALRMDLIRKRVELERRKRNLEEETKEVKRQISEVSKEILIDLAATGIRHVPLDDGTRLEARRYLHCSRRKGLTLKDALDAAKASGMEWLIRQDFSTSDLKLWLKEQEASGIHPEGPEAMLPDALRQVFGVYEDNRIVVVIG